MRLPRVGPTPAYTGPPQLARSVAIDDLTHPVVMESSSYVSGAAGCVPAGRHGGAAGDGLLQQGEEGGGPPHRRPGRSPDHGACLPGCLLINTFFIFYYHC
jgi:hypothetical protein